MRDSTDASHRTLLCLIGIVSLWYSKPGNFGCILALVLAYSMLTSADPTADVSMLWHEVKNKSICCGQVQQSCQRNGSFGKHIHKNILSTSAHSDERHKSKLNCPKQRHSIAVILKLATSCHSNLALLLLQRAGCAES